MRLPSQLAVLIAAFPMLMSGGDFSLLVHDFSRQTGIHQTHIPFMGLARFIVATAQPVGTSEFKLALFKNIDGRQGNFIDTADRLVDSGLWNRIVRVRSNKGEATNIYVQPQGKKLHILVTAIDNHDAVFVEVRIKPERLEAFVDRHRRQHD